MELRHAGKTIASSFVNGLINASGHKGRYELFLPSHFLDCKPHQYEIFCPALKTVIARFFAIYSPHATLDDFPFLAQDEDESDDAGKRLRESMVDKNQHAAYLRRKNDLENKIADTPIGATLAKGRLLKELAQLEQDAGNCKTASELWAQAACECLEDVKIQAGYLDFLLHEAREAEAAEHLLKCEPEVIEHVQIRSISSRIHSIIRGKEKEFFIPADAGTRHAPYAISAIVPNFNHARFLGLRLQSILNQTLWPDELIILDDASSDSSLAVIERFAKICPIALKIIPSKQHCGNIFQQWRKGIVKATGELIWIAESDDFCDADLLAKLVPHFSDSSVNLVWCDSRIVDKNGKELPDHYKEIFTRLSPDLNFGFNFRMAGRRLLQKALIHYCCLPNASAVLFRKSALPCDLGEIENYPCCGDWWLWRRIALNGKVVYESAILNAHRRASISKGIADGRALAENMSMQLDLVSKAPELYNEYVGLRLTLQLERAHRDALFAGAPVQGLWLCLHAIHCRAYKHIIEASGLATLLCPPLSLLRENAEAQRKRQLLSNSPFFDADFYLRNNPDLRACDVDPVEHYLVAGAAEGRLPFPASNIKLRAIFTRKRNNPVLFLEERRHRFSLLYEKIRIWRDIDCKNYHLVANSAYFNADYYLQRHVDLRDLTCDPVFHYLTHGVCEKRFCSASIVHVWDDVKPGMHGQGLIGWERHGRQRLVSGEDQNTERLLNEGADQAIIPLEYIKRAIESPKITTVSFDIFDTLLCRPVIDPSDLFSLADRILSAEGIEGFARMRSAIEEQIKDDLANIDEIYEYMREVYKLPYAVLRRMKVLELQLERCLLRPRVEIHELYEHAVKLGKRIIAISDMYLPAQFLCQILRDNGYEDISAIYVSNECGCRKRSGLYRYALAGEELNGYETAHIGDNLIHDYYWAQKSGMIAFWYPKATDLICRGTQIGLNFPQSGDLFARLILGFVCNLAANGFDNSAHRRDFFSSWSDVIHFGILPLLSGLGMWLINHERIQASYGQILFASRDGWLPMLVYEILRKNAGGLPGRYVYAGRRAYMPFTAKEFSALSAACQKDLMRSCCEHMHFCPLPQDASASYSSDVWKSHVLLRRVRSKFDAALRARNGAGRKYYRALVNRNYDREIIFDCGYSGSISKYLSPVIGKPLDKIYLYQTDENKNLDKSHGTKTFCILKDSEVPPTAVNIVYEEIFAPVEGACIGFKDSDPVIADDIFPDSMCLKYDITDRLVRDACTLLSDMLNPWPGIVTPNDFTSLQSIMNGALLRSSTRTLEHFADITFDDVIVNDKDASLADKLSNHLQYSDCFAGTPLSSSYIPDRLDTLLNHKMRIGIHVHLHSFWLAHEIIQYLNQIYFPVDIYFTCTSAVPTRRLGIYMSGLPDYVNVTYLHVPNRGRDVAPWLLATGKYQDSYDLFCHIHGKASHWAIWATQWRQYLWDNLLTESALTNIIKAFILDEKLGLAFPPPFKGLSDYCVQYNIPQFGMFGEIDMIRKILKRMQVNTPVSHRNLFFSLGTMFWYRPKALRQMFEFELNLDEFAAEPLGVGGTLAHAIERVPAFVCKHNGYNALMSHFNTAYTQDITYVEA